MPITDGWLNIFRLAADEPVQEPDANFESVHGLFGGDGPTAWLGTTLADGLEAMDASGTERALITVSARNSGGAGAARAVEFGSVEMGIEACRRASGRLRLVLQLGDVSSPRTAAQLVHAHGAIDEVVAVGVFPSALGCDLNDRKLYSVYTACIEEGLPVRINVGITGPLLPSRHQHPMLLEELLIDFPELIVIGCHMGHPWEHLMMRLIMKFPHLYLMTSAYLPRYFDAALVTFMNSSRGVGRVLFGSDHPGIPLARALEEASKLPLSEAALDQFLGDALCEVVGWA